MNTLPICPVCKKGEVCLHPDGRMCGCPNCMSVFKYPSMEEVPLTRQPERDENYLCGVNYIADADWLDEQATRESNYPKPW